MDGGEKFWGSGLKATENMGRTGMECLRYSNMGQILSGRQRQLEPDRVPATPSLTSLHFIHCGIPKGTYAKRGWSYS